MHQTAASPRASLASQHNPAFVTSLGHSQPGPDMLSCIPPAAFPQHHLHLARYRLGRNWVAPPYSLSIGPGAQRAYTQSGTLSYTLQDVLPCRELGGRNQAEHRTRHRPGPQRLQLLKKRDLEGHWGQREMVAALQATSFSDAH